VGEEIVVALAPAGANLRPLVLAQVRRPGLRQALEAKLPAGDHQVRIVDERALAAGAPAGRSDLLVLVTDALVAVAPDREALRAAVGPASGFVATPFGRRVADCYRDGVGVLFAADPRGRSVLLLPARRPGEHGPPAHRVDGTGARGSRPRRRSSANEHGEDGPADHACHRAAHRTHTPLAFLCHRRVRFLGDAGKPTAAG
jgi:hypothetical protein